MIVIILTRLKGKEILFCFSCFQILHVFFLQQTGIGHLIHRPAAPGFDAQKRRVFFDRRPESNRGIIRKIKLNPFLRTLMNQLYRPAGQIFIEYGILVKQRILQMQIINV